MESSLTAPHQSRQWPQPVHMTSARRLHRFSHNTHKMLGMVLLLVSRPRMQSTSKYRIKKSSMKLFWWIIPLLLLQNVSVSLADDLAARQRQQQRRREREERRRYQQERQQQQQQEYSHKSWENYMPNGDHAEQMKMYLGPRHILEALTNTLFVSGPILLVGAATLVGLPLYGTFGHLPESSRGGSKEDTSPVARRVLMLVVTSIMGGIVGGGCFLVGGIFGLWQVVVGTIRTPLTLWSFLQGHVHWKDHSWQPYNLTEHAEELESDGGSAGGLLASTSDDSLYKLLGVEPTATSKEIKRAYYKLAKQLHPDKQPDKEDEFRAVHAAYETLYNEDSRKAYDEWGTTSSSGKMPFDPTIFFDVLFGFSPELEHWIGDLGVKSFTTNLCQVIFMAQAASGGDEDEEKKQQIMQGLLKAMFDGTNHRESRQVDIAMWIQELTLPFVNRTMSLEEFEMLAQEQAAEVAESTPFPVLFMETIGSTIYWEGKGGFPTLSPLDLPFKMMTWTRNTGRSLSDFKSFVSSFYQLYKEYNERIETIDQSVRVEYNSDKKNKRKPPEEKEVEIIKIIRNQVFQDMIPSFMEYVWRYNQRDIFKTLKGACWKLLNDNNAGGRQNRRRQAKALVVLGNSFLKVVEMKKHECTTGISSEHDGGTSSSSGRPFMNDSDRLEVAIQMATTKVRLR